MHHQPPESTGSEAAEAARPVVAGEYTSSAFVRINRRGNAADGAALKAHTLAAGAKSQSAIGASVKKRRAACDVEVHWQTCGT
jgi:hypothetical protein